MPRRQGTQNEILATFQRDQDVIFEEVDFGYIYINTVSQIRVSKTVSFSKCTFKKLELFNFYFTQRFYIFDCKFEEHLILGNCIFGSKCVLIGVDSKDLRIVHNTFNKNFDIDKFKCSGTFNVQFSSVKENVSIEQFSGEKNPKDISIMFAEDSPAGSVNFRGFKANQITLSFPPSNMNHNVNISDFETDDLTIIMLSNTSDGKIYIHRIQATNITLFDLINNGFLHIKKLSTVKGVSNGKFLMHDCSFGKSEAYDVDFNSYDVIEIANSHLQTIIPSNITWNFRPTAYATIKPSYLRELFRQFKVICSSNMDKISTLKFEQLEMRYYGTQLHWRKNMGDWFILWSNKWSNNHGQSYGRAFLGLFITTIVFYNGMILTNHSFNTCYLFSSGVTFMNPLHSLKDIVCDKINNTGVYVWDVAQRLVSGYFIFQFLRAFRKFVN